MPTQLMGRQSALGCSRCLGGKHRPALPTGQHPPVNPHAAVSTLLTVASTLLKPLGFARTGEILC